jgi:hypothetical protein
MDVSTTHRNIADNIHNALKAGPLGSIERIKRMRELVNVSLREACIAVKSAEEVEKEYTCNRICKNCKYWNKAKYDLGLTWCERLKLDDKYVPFDFSCAYFDPKTKV